MARFRSLEDSSRREFLRFAAAGASFASLSGWLNVLAARAADSGAKHKSCILLWMEGGASHKDTFDLKPGTADGGEFKPIATSVPGLEISEHLPKVARQMHHAALLRGMSTTQVRTGRPATSCTPATAKGAGAWSIRASARSFRPSWAAPGFPLPNFVAVGGKNGYGAGFLGVRHQPLIVNDPAKGVENLSPMVATNRFEKRFGLLEELEHGFLRTARTNVGGDHNTTYERTLALMQSKEAKAFDLTREPATARSAYGQGEFAQGCLLARRLVEVGVPFVEVFSPGWDTHQDNFNRVKKLSTQIDTPIAALISDLEMRGLLDSTLVIWMGEFGRTPKITTKGGEAGRGHYPRAWSTVLFGGGIPGGQVIGKTDSEGAAVIDRPISALDFLATVCTILGIDHTKQNPTPIGRPIRIVDNGARPIKELLG